MKLKVKPLATLLFIPLIVLASLPYIMVSYNKLATGFNVERGLIVPPVSSGWQESSKAIRETVGQFQSPTIYYKVLEWETSGTVAEHFGVDHTELLRLNPKGIIPGSTIILPPITEPLSRRPLSPVTQQSIQTVVTDTHISLQTPIKSLQTFDLRQVAQVINDTNILEEVEPKHWVLKRSLMVGHRIRVQLTTDQVTRLDLLSDAKTLVCLCADGGQLLIDGLTITSLDPSTKNVDTNLHDKRSFVRAIKNSRMDILNSELHHLGYDADKEKVLGGGAYGVSWRTNADEQNGLRVVTGWSENNKFHNNYRGAYVALGSGLVLKNNQMYDNVEDGVSIQNQSIGLVVEGNTVRNNGRHGIELSERSVGNKFTKNQLIDNKDIGILLRGQSNYNLIDQNTASGNSDNCAITDGSANTINANILSQPDKNNIRLDSHAKYNIIAGNQLNDKTGIKIQDQSEANLLAENTISTDDRAISVDKTGKNTVIEANIIKRSGRVRIADPKIVIMGPMSFPDQVQLSKKR